MQYLVKLVSRMLNLSNRSALYRIITALGFLLCIVSGFIIPYPMREPDSWAYYYATENFSQGKLVVDDQLHEQQFQEVREQGGWLVQYVQIDDNKWALEKAPGYVFFLVPFELLGIPRVANLLLALGLVVITYLLLRRLRDEKAACIGSLLMLLTPVSLIMLQRSYMAMFGASAFLAIGGGLYLYYCLEQKRLKPLVGYSILFLATLFISWSVVARYTNLLIAVVFALHFVITRLRILFKGQRHQVAVEAIPFSLGVAIPLAVLLIYHNYVFGSPLASGYQYTLFPIKFAFQYIGAVGWDGQSIPMRIIEGNLRNMPAALFIGFPLLVIAIPGIGYILYQKLSPLIRGRDRSKEKTDQWAELPGDILLVLIGWIICVYPLYMLYEWTSDPSMQQLPFISAARFYLPGLFPVVIFTSLMVARFPKKLAIILLAMYLALGSALYAQSALTGVGPPPGGKPTQWAQLVGPSSQAVERIINQTRNEVETVPTNEHNIDRRYNVLHLWAIVLENQGYPVYQILPPEKLLYIAKLVEAGDIPQAAHLIDQGYRDLEKMVAR